MNQIFSPADSEQVERDGFGLQRQGLRQKDFV